jgi:hypothetical protein
MRPQLSSIAEFLRAKRPREQRSWNQFSASYREHIFVAA